MRSYISFARSFSWLTWRKGWTFEAMRSLGQAGGGAPAELALLEGFPVKTVLYPRKGDKPPLTIEIVEANRETLPMWEFDLPPGADLAPLGPGPGGKAP